MGENGNQFKGKINLDIRDSSPDWDAFLYQKAPLAGVSMHYSFNDANAATRKETQYYEMVGTSGIWHKGWKAATLHAPAPADQGNFDKDVWQLFNTEEDRSEARDLAAKHPEKLKELQDLWLAEAQKNNVLPLIDVGVELLHKLEFHAAPPASGRYVYYPGTTEVPEATAARTLGSSFKALAEVEFTFNKDSISKNLETLGHMKLYVDDKIVAEGPFRTQSGHYALCGEGLSIGTDSGDSVSSEYKPKFEFTGGRVIKVIFDVAKDV